MAGLDNLPCKGCWWIEGARCYQDKLADVHGLARAPRIGDPKPYGLEITDALITACMSRGVHERKSAVYGRLAAHLRDIGVEVVFTSSPTIKDSSQ
jgi:hypothetical protein